MVVPEWLISVIVLGLVGAIVLLVLWLRRWRRPRSSGFMSG